MEKVQTVQKFNTGDMIVYPIQGVGHVDEIETREFKGNRIPYYVITLEAADMVLRVPVHKSEELRIRPIVSESSAESALNSISNPPGEDPSDWKQRYSANMELLKKGGIEHIAEVVCKLYHRSKVKDLPVQERKLYDDALRLFIDESAHSMNRNKEEIEQLIFCRLEQD